MLTHGVVVVVSTLAACAAARPPWFGGGPGSDLCINEATANELVTNFISLTDGPEVYNKTLAKAVIAKDVVDTSGSVASIINAGNTGPVPLLGPIFANRSEFISNNAAQAPTPYQPLNIYWNCDTVTFRFKISGPDWPQPVLGITILETERAPAGSEFPFKIKTVYGELNSLAFAIDLGLYTPLAAPPPPPQARDLDVQRTHFGHIRK